MNNYFLMCLCIYFQYLGWLNNKKSRIMDQFKKIDRNNLGKVTKQDFIDGILKSSKRL